MKKNVLFKNVAAFVLLFSISEVAALKKTHKKISNAGEVALVAPEGHNQFIVITAKAFDASRAGSYEKAFAILQELNTVKTEKRVLDLQLQALVAQISDLVQSDEFKKGNKVAIAGRIKAIKEQLWAFASLAKLHFGHGPLFKAALQLKKELFVKWLQDNNFAKKRFKKHFDTKHTGNETPTSIVSGFKGQQSGTSCNVLPYCPYKQ